jgi:hypothetical protein
VTDAAELELIRAIGLVLVALITALGGVLIALLNRTRQHAKAARDQVENNHATNLRDEADERHGQNLSRLATLERGQAQLQRSVTRIETHLGIEKTIPRPPTRKKRS